jgi:hypothetical protein
VNHLASTNGSCPLETRINPVAFDYQSTSVCGFSMEMLVWAVLGRLNMQTHFYTFTVDAVTASATQRWFACRQKEIPRSFTGDFYGPERLCVLRSMRGSGGD